jgi:hypothetical protein
VFIKKEILSFYPKDAGNSQSYNGKGHIWLDGRGATDGMVWSIIGNSNDK